MGTGALDVATLGIRVVYDDVTKATSAVEALGIKGEQAGKRITAGFQPLKKVTEDTQRTMQPLLLGFDQFASVTGGPATSAIREFGRATRESAGHAANHALATGKVTRALEGLAVEALGANHHLAQLGVTFAEFGAGHGPVLIALGAVAGLGLAYEKLTEKAREEAKAQQEAVDALTKFNTEARAGFGGSLAVNIEKAREQVERLRKEVEKPGALQKFIDLISGSAAAGLGPAVGIADVIRQMLGGKTTIQNAGQLDTTTDETTKAEEELEKRFAQTTGAIALQIERQKALNDAFGKGDYEIALINHKFDYLAAVLEHTVGLTKTQEANMNALSAAMRIAADEGAVLADVQARVAAAMKASDAAFERLGVAYTSGPNQRFATDVGAQIIGLQHSFGASAVESFDESWKKTLENANKVTREVEKQAQGIRDAADAAIGMAEAFGFIDKNVGSAAAGIAQLVAGIGPLKDSINRYQSGTGGFGSVLTSAAPVVGGLTSALVAFQSVGEANRKAAEAMATANKDFAKSMRDFTTGFAKEWQDIQDRAAGLSKQARDTQLPAFLRQYVAETNPNFGLTDDAVAAKREREARIQTDFWASIGEQFNALAGPMGDYLNAQNAIIKKYQEERDAAVTMGASIEDLTRLETLRDAQLQKLVSDLEQAATSSLLGRLGITSPAAAPFLGDSKNGQWFDTFTHYVEGVEATNKRIQEEAEKNNFYQSIQTQIAQEQLSKLTEQTQLSQQTVDGLRSTVDALAKYSDSLKLSTLSPLTSIQRYTTAEQQFEALVAKAFAGDQNAVKSLTGGGADTFLKESQSRYASSRTYVADYNRVQSVLGGLEGLYGPQLTAEEKILAELKKQTEIATRQLDTQQSSLVSQLVQRANDKPAEAGRISAQLHGLGFTLGADVINVGGGMAVPGAYYALPYNPQPNAPGQGNTGQGSTIYNPQYQAYLDNGGSLSYDEWLNGGQSSSSASAAILGQLQQMNSNIMLLGDAIKAGV